MFTQCLWWKMAGNMVGMGTDFLQYVGKASPNRWEMYEITHCSQIWVINVWLSAMLISIHFYLCRKSQLKNIS